MQQRGTAVIVPVWSYPCPGVYVRIVVQKQCYHVTPPPFGGNVERSDGILQLEINILYTTKHATMH